MIHTTSNKKKASTDQLIIKRRSTLTLAKKSLCLTKVSHTTKVCPGVSRAMQLEVYLLVTPPLPMDEKPLSPELNMPSTHLYTCLGRGITGESKVSCSRIQHYDTAGLEPGLFNLESSTRPHHAHHQARIPNIS